MRNPRRTRSVRFQLEPMEERAVTSSLSFNQFHPTIALQKSAAAARAAASRFAVPNRFGPVLAAHSAARVSSTAAARAAIVVRPAPPSQAVVTSPAANTNIADVKNGPMAKAGQELINLYLDYQAFVQAGGEGTFRSTHAPGLQVVGSSVRLDIKGTSGTASALTSLGMKIESTDPHTGIIEGLLPIAQLPNAAQLSQVTMIRGVHYPGLAR